MPGEQQLPLFNMMKAICLLLCIALARDSAGHIFKRHRYNQHMENAIAQNKMEFDDSQQENGHNGNEMHQNQRQYVKQYDNSQSNEQERHQPITHQQKQAVYGRQEASGSGEHKEGKHYPRQYATNNVNSQSNEQENYQSMMHERQQEDPHQQQYKNEHNQERKQRKAEYNQLYPQSEQLYSKQQKNRHQEEANKMHAYQQTSDSSSMENNSHEKSKEDKYATQMYADTPTLATRLTSNLKSQNKKEVSGDSIAWRGVQIATGPKYSVYKEDIEKIFQGAYNTMNHLSEENKKIFHQAVEEAKKSGDEDVHLNATELLNKYQYEAETYTIKTDDGYYLTLFRIPAKQQTPQRPVVFLMHGLLGSADDWLLMGPGKSLAYLLADAGYEVWLGNARGSKYSRRHVTKYPALADFWQYGTDEIALHDLPAMIDFVLKTSNQQKMYYVGHSQGTTAFFALAASRPEYNDKINMMYALSPMVYMSNVRSPLLRMIAPNSQFHNKLNHQLGNGEFKPTSELVHTVGGAMLESEIGCKNIYSNVNFVVSGANVEDLEVKNIPVILGHLPAGASTKQMKQYAQAVASQEFTKYDYGSVINQRVYGSSQPPQYQMHKVQVPVALYYSDDDWLAHPQDVARLEKELPNVKDSYKVAEPHFNNMDFQFSKKAPKAIYNRLIESIQKQDQQNYVY